MICCLIISFVVYPLFKCFKSSVYLISLEEKNQGLHNEKEVDSTKPHLTFVMQLLEAPSNWHAPVSLKYYELSRYLIFVY